MKKIIVIVLSLAFIFLNKALSLADDKQLDTSWKTIETPHFNIIFRANMLLLAQKIANTLELIYEPESRVLNTKPQKSDIFIMNEFCVANAGTTHRRITWYVFPPPSTSPTNDLLGVNDWHEFLAVHEFRHICQNNKEREGLLMKIVHFCGGEIFVGNILSNFTHMHKWWYEGDAVGTETVFTRSGRGRSPSFLMPHKANLLEGNDYSFHKIFNGSYKDNTLECCYPMGYILATHLKRNYGVDVIAKINEELNSKFVFHFAVSSVTGRSLTQIFDDANNEILSLWKEQISKLKITGSQSLINRKSNVYTNYKHPHVDEDGNVIVLKDGFDKYSQFVSINTNDSTQKTILTPYTLYQHWSSFSIAKNKILWLEEQVDILYRSFEDRIPPRNTTIRYYDLNEHKSKSIATGRYTCASLSPNAQRVVVFESDISYNNSIVILDTESGEEIKRFSNPENALYTDFSWSSDGKKILAVKTSNRKSSLVLIDVDTEEYQDIIPPSYENVSNPVMHDKYVLYNSPYNGIDNIYAINLEDKQQYQITSKKYGAFDPVISKDGKWIYFNDYTSDGMDVVKMPFDTSSWVPLQQVEVKVVNYSDPLIKEEGDPDLLDKVPNVLYPVKPYSLWKHLFNLSSWMPIIFPRFTADSSLGVNAGITIKTEDPLEIMSLGLDYEFVYPEKAGAMAPSIEFKSLYPVVKLSGKFNHISDEIVSQEGDLSFIFPIAFVYGQFLNKVVNASTFTISSTKNIKEVNQEWHTSYPIKHEIIVTTESRKAKRDIVTPWCNQIILIGYYDIKEKNNKKPITIHTNPITFAGRHKLNVPGFMKNTSFSIRSIYSYIIVGNKNGSVSNGNHYFFNNLKCTPYFKNNSLINGHLWSMKINYIFPIWYPDLSLSYFLYFKRLSQTCFVEYTKLPNTLYYKNYWTLGIDTYFEFSPPTLDPNRAKISNMIISLGYHHVLGMLEPHRFVFTLSGIFGSINKEILRNNEN